MDYIWNQDALWALLKHHSEDVQAWAAMRLLELYPETANELLRRLPQFASDAASTILSSESHRDCPPELMTFFQQTREPHLKAGAAALLIRFGTTLSDTQLTNVNLDSRFEGLADTAWLRLLAASLPYAGRRVGIPAVCIGSRVRRCGHFRRFRRRHRTE
jgi:hypothetical protein